MPPDVDREGCEAPEVFGEEIIDELVAAQERGSVSYTHLTLPTTPYV